MARTLPSDRMVEEWREVVKALLKEQGTTQRELAARMNLTEGRISQILHGSATSNPTLKTVADIGFALGVRFLPVLTVDEEPPRTVTYRGVTYERVPK